MFQIKTKVIYNKKVHHHYFRLLIEATKIIKEAHPGQFLDIRVNDSCQPLLRRPFSIHSARNGVEILYEVVGVATEILSKRKSKEYLDVIGPLGNGFNYRLPITDYRLPILVAGGMGVAPLLFLAERIKKCQSVKVSKCQSMILIGAKTKNQILCEKEFKELGCTVKIATDDGSRGFKGKVTDLLRKILRLAISDKRPPHSFGGRPPSLYGGRFAIYACGPRPMLKEIAAISKKYNIPAQISLEEHMACGIGACLGCAVNTKNGFKRVCKEGPVFEANEIVW